MPEPEPEYAPIVQARSLGIRQWAMTRDTDSDRRYRVTYLVEVYALNEDEAEVPVKDYVDQKCSPALVRNASGLPLPGDYFGQGDDGIPEDDKDVYALCEWTQRVRPYKQKRGEKGAYFEVTLFFSTGRDISYAIRPDEDRSTPDHWNHISITGGYTQKAKLMKQTNVGNPLTDFIGGGMQGDELMRNVSYPTVTIQINYGNFNDSITNGTTINPTSGAGEIDANTVGSSFDVSSMISRLTYAVNKVNYNEMWGFPPRHVRLESVDWDLKWRTSNDPYLETTLKFVIAPPWLTQIAQGNSAYRAIGDNSDPDDPNYYRRSKVSYGWDEPFLVRSVKVLDKNAFKRPNEDELSPGDRDYQKPTQTSSASDGEGEDTSEGQARPKIDYHCPPELMQWIADSDNGTDTEELQQILGHYFLINGTWYLLSEFSTANQDATGFAALPTLDDPLVQQELNRAGIVGPENRKLQYQSWFYWNVPSAFDLMRTFLIWAKERKEADPSLEVTLSRYVNSQGNLNGESATLLPTVMDQSLSDLWTNTFSYGQLDNKITIEEEGWPIWVNTECTVDNFDKWPGFPVLPGQDPAEALIFPPIDGGFDFLTELNIPPTIPQEVV